MNWTNEQYEAFQARRAAFNPKPECSVPYEPLAEAGGKTENSGSIPTRVRITSYRRRLLDWDNLAGGCKYFCDCCTYSGLIPGDAPDQITLEVSQVKVKTKQEERTEITIT